MPKAQTRNRTMTFSEFMVAVDDILETRYGVISDDIPDFCYADAHARGDGPLLTAVAAFRAANE